MRKLILKHALMQVFCDVPESLIENWEAISQQPDDSAFFELLERNEVEVYCDYEYLDMDGLISKVNEFIHAFTDFYEEVNK